MKSFSKSILHSVLKP